MFFRLVYNEPHAATEWLVSAVGRSALADYLRSLAAVPEPDTEAARWSRATPW
jgi:hypothetical protein